ncbi:MAG TPA: glycosyltransferase [Lacunisphaera sp.]|jgi:glycosyltransferase involved in cell wall biosynthesis
MPRTVYVTTELPYFPGQGGLMALHIGHLAGMELTGVVGPRYPHQPEDALQRMRDTVQRSYWWPEHSVPGDYLIAPILWTHHTEWLRHLPKGIKLALWRRLTGLNHFSNEAFAWRSVLTNLAPKILEALRSEQWNVVLLSQSLSVSWFNFLPASLARCLYFHDIRSDYLSRAPVRPTVRNLRRIINEEHTAATHVDAIAVVSELDRVRAEKILHPNCPVAIAPICVDLDYFSFEPDRSNAPVVLFTGHLSHPPNVDATVYFLTTIWPQILMTVPAATLRLVGLHPAPVISEAIARTKQVELIANVPDIRPYYRHAAVYVVPMRYGGGVRQKIVEAWAVGLPVITTTMGAEGLDAVDGTNCWLCDDPATFAQQVVSRLREPAPRELLQAARALAETKHSSSVSSPILAAQINLATRRRKQQPPKVLYDLRWLKPGQAGGVEQMTYELVDELACFDRTFDYRFYGPRTAFKNLKFPRAFKHKIFHSDGRLARWLGWRDAAAQELASDLSLPSLMTPELNALEWYTRLDFTVVHGLPCHVHQDLRRFPSVVTMHDLQHLHLPENFSATDIAIREKEYRESCRVAAHVICTSEFTRQDVHQRYGVPLEKMTTIWNLPPRLMGEAMAPSTIRRLLKGLGIKAPFLYYPAQPWLHKNHRTLLEAISLLDHSLPKDYKLVLTGQPFPADHPAAALMLSPAIRDRVIHLGYRSPAQVAALYRTAQAMIFPSLFEGFGLPLVEAMQQGCPIVCGQHTCLPEIVGSAGLFTDVSSPDALARAILSITQNDKLRVQLQQNGTTNMLRFDRRQLAEKTRAIYEVVHQAHFS